MRPLLAVSNKLPTYHEVSDWPKLCTHIAKFISTFGMAVIIRILKVKKFLPISGLELTRMVLLCICLFALYKAYVWHRSSPLHHLGRLENVLFAIKSTNVDTNLTTIWG